jgi:hypothetical protein
MVVASRFPYLAALAVWTDAELKDLFKDAGKTGSVEAETNVSIGSELP